MSGGSNSTSRGDPPTISQALTATSVTTTSLQRGGGDATVRSAGSTAALLSRLERFRMIKGLPYTSVSCKNRSLTATGGD
ncbi:MAG: hypothetical protein GEEBNDBF_01708 [bacterium]|nr:hypothetical protein [bacterium]